MTQKGSFCTSVVTSPADHGPVPHRQTAQLQMVQPCSGTTAVTGAIGSVGKGT